MTPPTSGPRPPSCAAHRPGSSPAHRSWSMVAPPAACSDARPWPRDDQRPGGRGVSPDRRLRGSRPRPGPGDPAARRRSPRRDPALTQERRPVGDLEHQRHVLLDDQDPRPRVRGDRSEHGEAGSSTMMGARPRLSSSTRRRRGAHSTARASANICCSPPDNNPALRLESRSSWGNHSMIWSIGTPPPRAGRPNRRSLGNGQAEEEASVLGDVGDPRSGPAPHLGGRATALGSGRPPEHGEGAVGERHQARDGQQGRRLAGAVGADQGHHLALTNDEVEIVHHGDAVVAEGDAVEAEKLVGAHGRSSSRRGWRPR